MNACIIFLPDVIRIDYMMNDSLMFDESSDTNRKQILLSSSISCLSKDQKDIRAFNLFVTSCFEIVICRSQILCGKEQLEELEGLCSSTFRRKGDELYLDVKRNDNKGTISQLEMQTIIIQYIKSKLRREDYRKIQFVYNASLKECALVRIRKLFKEEKLEIECCRFQDFDQLNSSGTKKRDKKYFQSISMKSCDDSLTHYYHDHIDTVNSASDINRFEDFSLLCRVEDSQFVTLLDEEDVVKVYFPFSPSHGSQIHLNIFIQDVILRKEFIGGIRLKCESKELQTDNLPQYVMLVKCQRIKKHLVFEITIVDTVNFVDRRFFYGDWETNVNMKLWDYDVPISTDNCLFSFIPMVDQVVVRNELPVLYGRIYDLLGNQVQKGKLSLISDQVQKGDLVQTLKVDPIADSTNMNTQSPNHWELLSSLYYNVHGVNVLHCNRDFLYVGGSSNNVPHGRGFVISSKGQLLYHGEFKGGYLVDGIRFDIPVLFNFCLIGKFEKEMIVGDYTLMDKRTKMKYITAHMEDKSISNGNMYEYDRVVFSGTFNDFEPVKGTMFYYNGNKKYEGEIKNRNADGYGTFYLYEESSLSSSKSMVESRKQYEGFFKDGLRSGSGVLFSRCGRVGEELVLYKGEFENDVFSGNGMYFVSPIASWPDDKLVITEKNAEYIDIWESGKKYSDILMFKGTFENGHPLKGIVHFYDRATAEVEWKDGALVGNGIKNYYCKYRILCDFVIRDWVIHFCGKVVHGIRHPGETQFYLLRTCIYDNEKHCIKNYVLEQNKDTDSEVVIKRYEITPLPNKWMWKYGKSIEIDKSDPDYLEICKLQV